MRRQLRRGRQRRHSRCGVFGTRQKVRRHPAGFSQELHDQVPQRQVVGREGYHSAR